MILIFLPETFVNKFDHTSFIFFSLLMSNAELFYLIILSHNTVASTTTQAHRQQFFLNIQSLVYGNYILTASKFKNFKIKFKNVKKEKKIFGPA